VVNRIIQGDTTYSIKIERVGRDAKKFIINDETFKMLLDEKWKKVRSEEAARKMHDEKFINENYPGLDSLPGSIRYKIISTGTGEKPAHGSLLEVKYSGRLINGTTFGSTADTGRPAPGTNPAIFAYLFGKDQIIKGLEVSLADMKRGEKRIIVIPPGMAYGNNGFYARDVPGQKRFVISPGEILILEVTMVSIK
jgi:peptidylprolyl isomerase